MSAQLAVVTELVAEGEDDIGAWGQKILDEFDAALRAARADYPLSDIPRSRTASGRPQLGRDRERTQQRVHGLWRACTGLGCGDGAPDLARVARCAARDPVRAGGVPVRAAHWVLLMFGLLSWAAIVLLWATGPSHCSPPDQSGHIVCQWANR